jgi:hypothetical protein
VSALDGIYALSHPFVGHALRAFAVAGIAALIALATRLVRQRARLDRRTASPTPWIVVAIAWSVFGACEAEATRERADIRVDLLVSWPVLCLVTVVCLLLFLRGASRLGQNPDRTV